MFLFDVSSHPEIQPTIINGSLEEQAQGEENLEKKTVNEILLISSNSLGEILL